MPARRPHPRCARRSRRCLAWRGSSRAGSAPERISPMAEAHAPGKLVICGEYAVLHGAPAIAVAVDVRARAGVHAVAGASRLTLPDERRLGIQLGAAARPTGVSHQPMARGRILEAVAAALAARGALMSAGVEICLDTPGLPDHPQRRQAGKARPRLQRRDHRGADRRACSRRQDGRSRTAPRCSSSAPMHIAASRAAAAAASMSPPRCMAVWSR